MADTEYMTLRAAVDKLNVNGLDARLYVVTDMLTLFATLTRHNFNDGREEEVFFVGVHDGRVLRESLEGNISALKARLASGERASEISPRFLLDLKREPV